MSLKIFSELFKNAPVLLKR